MSAKNAISDTTSDVMKATIMSVGFAATNM
jgi:hypothetical protein